MAHRNNPAPSTPTQMLPHSLEAERAVLGTFFLDEKTLPDVQGLLTAADFYDPRHQQIYETICLLVDQGKPVDPMLLVEEIQRQGLLESIGGPGYIASLEQSVITPDNVRHHANIVYEKSLLRRLIRATSEIGDTASREAKDTKELLLESEKRILELINQRQTSDFKSIEQESYDVIEEIEERSKNRQEVTGVPTHLNQLNQKTGGLQPSDLIILAARPSVGKTSLALNIGLAAAKSHYHNGHDTDLPPAVAIFSLEMGIRQVIHRLVCTESEIRMDLLRKNMLTEKHREQFAETLDEMRRLQIFINDTSSMSIMEMRMHAQRLHGQHPNLSLVIVDYLQLMSGGAGRTENRQQEVSEISRGLKGLARDLHCPVLALSQLSRGVESRRGEDARPRLSDLRESGAIEQDADVVMFIHPTSPRQESEENPNMPSIRTVDLVIAKQRNGPIGTCHMLFREDFTQFVDLASDQVPQ